MIAQGKPTGSGLVLGLFFWGFQNKNQKKAQVRPFIKHWLNLNSPGSLNPCQDQCLHLGQEIHPRQGIIHRHQETQLK